ncbi:hypothetical protein NDU88_000089 [Pleurodeles waltl]|uniref:Uncharacterized protein n=1 Tax=Pleurodeles waltl TaxID=8319 RepID=A0AAV7Q2V3_PLEWA|nr:hypothetical protein NDU88_000089 [Pleurodeles waltl]
MQRPQRGKISVSYPAGNRNPSVDSRDGLLGFLRQSAVSSVVPPQLVLVQLMALLELQHQTKAVTRQAQQPQEWDLGPPVAALS